MALLKSNFVVIKVSVIAALAGLLFGLDIAYVNGALHFITEEFGLDVGQQGDVAAYLVIGAALGALFSGWISHRIGRKKVLVLAGFIFTASTLGAVLSHNFTTFLALRFVMGTAIGLSSFVAPLYLSEIAPYKIRGSLIALFQLMITIGILVMFISNTQLEFTGSWRIMMSVLLIPSALMLFGTLTLPESPRWLALKGNTDGAKKILTKIRSSSEEVELELSQIKNTIKSKLSMSKLFKQKFFLKVLALGVALQALQQFSGMNAFMYYSHDIFVTAGFDNPGFSTVMVGLVNVITTIFAIKLIDKIGRKTILYIGLSILIISCAVVGYLFNLKSGGAVLSIFEQRALLGFCLLFIFGFAMSLGPIVWIMCAEIMPLEGRDFGVTLSTIANWIINTIISKYTLIWFAVMGVGNTIWMFGVFLVLGLFLVKFFTPETKDTTLEEIEENLKAGKCLANIGK